MTAWLVTATILAAAPTLAAASPASAPPAAAETVDSLVRKHVAARGGFERLQSVRTLRARGSLRLGGRHEAAFTMVWARPGRARIELAMLGQTSVQVLDGAQGWQVAPLLGQIEPAPLPADLVAHIARGVDLEGPLVDYARKGHRVRLAGRASVGEAPAWELEVTTADGSLVRILLSAADFLELKETTRDAGTGLEVETTYGDYRPVDGLRLPFRLTSALKGSAPDTTTVDAIELNVPVSAAAFAKR